MVQSESYGNMMKTQIAFQAGFKCTKRSYSDVITAAQSRVMQLTRRLIASCREFMIKT